VMASWSRKERSAPKCRTRRRAGQLCHRGKLESLKEYWILILGPLAEFRRIPYLFNRTSLQASIIELITFAVTSTTGDFTNRPVPPEEV
jgi:hypothetical protein